MWRTAGTLADVRQAREPLAQPCLCVIAWRARQAPAHADAPCVRPACDLYLRDSLFRGNVVRAKLQRSPRVTTPPRRWAPQAPKAARPSHGGPIYPGVRADVRGMLRH
jgi:hypothetical protein